MNHVFDEGIPESGVLTWQSQPRQRLADIQIQQFIHHDELQNSIYLSLRTRDRDPYTHLGRLKYLSHDQDREQLVYFQWQLLDFPIPPDVVRSMRLEYEGALLVRPTEPTAPILPGLTETSRPKGSVRRPMPTKTFQARKVADYTVQDAKNKALGLAGERLAVQHEIDSLVARGQSNLAAQVRHVSLIEGEGTGYDVLLFDAAGQPKYIEVKTTSGPADASFFVSANEVAFSREHPDGFYLYRVYAHDADTQSGQFYVARGPMFRQFHLMATNYRVSLPPEE